MHGKHRGPDMQAPSSTAHVAAAASDRAMQHQGDMRCAMNCVIGRQVLQQLLLPVLERRRVETRRNTTTGNALSSSLCTVPLHACLGVLQKVSASSIILCAD